MKTLISRYPLQAYLFLTFFISYFLGIPFNGWTSSFFITENELVGMYAPILITVFGPALAALGVQWARGGRKGVAELVRKLRLQKQHWAAYVLIPASACLLAFSVFALQGVPVVKILKEEGHWLLLQLLAQILLVGIGEELGWRGWLQPYLNKRFPLLKATVVTAIIWGLWHFPKLFISLQLSLSFALSWLALSFLFCYKLYWLKMNVLLVAIGHAAFNAPIFFLENRLVAWQLDAAILTDSLLWISLCYAVLAIVLLIADRSFWRRSEEQALKRKIA